MPVAGLKDATTIAHRRREGSPFDACSGVLVCLISGLMLWHRTGCGFVFRYSSPRALGCLGPVRWRGPIPDAAHAEANIIREARRALDHSDPFSPLPPKAGTCLGKFDALHLGPPSFSASSSRNGIRALDDFILGHGGSFGLAAPQTSCGT